MSKKIPATQTSWTGVWNPDEQFKGGDGVWIEGTIQDIRFHSVQAKNDVARYYSLVVDIKAANKRTYNKSGTEVTPEMGKGPSSVNHDQLMNIIGRNSGKPLPANFLESALFDNLHPKVKGRFEFWATTEQAKNYEIGFMVMIKTKGDTPFVEKIMSTDVGQFTGREGGEVLNQIAKLSNVYGKSGALKQDQAEGVDPSEWDD